ncbi:M56 family metallopeptidase [Flavobacterium sp. AG291]|uniref:M56 family metallopeptidase n=1 Tax=Flavobacterium sp. AG291 TaxID=2184000 RepID=UPI000E0BE2AC|nr:M56 family metallopeptidase [Flavobacterium sp. AG291]RDI14682.1 beta-lactamase regulating signal transducer with metallopeptidase domain [Flavobacterium sp. AG291]
MENFIIYISKASGLLAVFFIAYYVFLRKETFFNSNRGFLLAGLITSTLLPLVKYTKTIFVEPVQQSIVSENISNEQLQQYLVMQQFMAAKQEPFTINWYYIVIAIYSIGLLFFLMRFVMDFLSIRKILKGNSIIKQGRFKLIDSEKVQSPFSFFNYIVYNSASLQTEELESILNHEKVHSSQKHSADMIISQLFCIVFWFNPFVWFYKKAISQNLEFIADAVAIKQLSDKKAYQKTLLKITLQPECISITNHFYQSLIKKRIVMLNKKQSKKRNSWKYGIVLPALAAFILMFQVKVVAQEKATEVNTSSQEKTKIVITIDKSTSDEELNANADIFKDEFEADVTFSNVARNTSGEITAIKATVKDKDQSQDHYVSGTTPIKPFTIEMEKNSNANGNIIGFGNPNPFNVTANKASVASAKENVPIHTNVNYNTSSSTGYINGPNAVNLYKGAVFYVNGVEQKEIGDNLKDLQLPKGQTIMNMAVLTAKDAKKKYGKKAKNGAVEITTQPIQSNFSYSYGNSDNMNNSFNFTMPNMDEVMSLALNGVSTGMDALANIDWQKNFAFEGISEEERKEIQDEMKKAQIEIQQAMKELQIDRQEIEKSINESLRDSGVKDHEMKQVMKEMEQAKQQMKEAQKQLEAARLDLQKAEKEIEKKKALSKKS